MRRAGRISLAVALCLLGAACSVTRHLPEDAYLVQRVKIEDDKSVPRRERITASELSKYVRQTPNKRLLGTNFYVWLYEQADSSKHNKWNDWKRRVGEAPVLLDMNLTRKSAENLKVYMDTRGYFASRATYEVDTVSRRKRALITYRTHQGEPYRIGSVKYEFRDAFLEQILLPDTSRTLLHPGVCSTSRSSMPSGCGSPISSRSGVTTISRRATSNTSPTRSPATGASTSRSWSSSIWRGTTAADVR